jgi:hypothetical protein
MNGRAHNSQSSTSYRVHFGSDTDIGETTTGEILNKIGLSEIEWASALIPVLAVEQGIDLRHGIMAGIKSRLVKRTDLAARLGVDSKKPIGSQLVAQGMLSYAEGRLVDGDLFQNRLLELRLRIDETTENSVQLLADLQSRGVIEEIETEEKHDNYLLVGLRTLRFVEFVRTLSQRAPGMAVLLSINDSIVYV